MTSTVDYRGDLSARGEGRSWLWHARQPLVPLIKGSLRAVGMATAARRSLPDFIVIGAKRGGSTSIYRNLVAGPGVVGLFPGPAEIKGTYYFDVEYQRGERWYRSHFPTRAARATGADVDGAPALTGEASPYYLIHPHAARRAFDLAPDAKIIVALRDPVDRAFSHYQERVRQGIETIDSFADAIAAEPGRLAGEVDRMLAEPEYVSAAHLNFGYLAQSEYDTGLGRWLEAFSASSVLVLRSEDFYADERATLAEVRTFLGLAPVDLPEPRHFNATGADDLDRGLAQDLRTRLTPSVERLEQMLDRQFDWW